MARHAQRPGRDHRRQRRPRPERQRPLLRRRRPDHDRRRLHVGDPERQLGPGRREHGRPGRAVQAGRRTRSGNWGPAAGWEKGVARPLPERPHRRAGLRRRDRGRRQLVYVASERDNTNSNVSKISVLEVNPSNIVAQNGDADGDLNATHEWDLGSDLGPNPGKNAETGLDPNNPGDANLGIEAVAFVPDSYLTGAGFKDEHTGAAYDPSQLPEPHRRRRVLRRPGEDRQALRLRLQQRQHLHPHRHDQHRLPDDPGPAVGPVAGRALGNLRQRLPGSQLDHQDRHRRRRAPGHVPDADGLLAPDRRGAEPEQRGLHGGSRSPSASTAPSTAFWSDDTDDGEPLAAHGRRWTAPRTPRCRRDHRVGDPPANANGWNNTAVTVSFSCTDPARASTRPTARWPIKC